MLKKILNKLTYTDMLMKLQFPSIVLSNWLPSEDIFAHMLKKKKKVLMPVQFVVDRINFSICPLFPGFTP